MSRWDERAKKQKAEREAQTEAERADWNARKAAAEAKRGDFTEPSQERQVNVPGTYTGELPPEGATPGRFWFELDDGSGWVCEFGWRWPSSEAPVDAL